jgi:hypothetical protein
MTISALLGAGQSLVPPQIIVLSEPEARHLARWLRDQGFLDDVVRKQQGYVVETDEPPDRPVEGD